MTQGSMIRVGVSMTGDNPKIYRDPMMSKGTLMMWDPSQSVLSNFPAGSVIENIAADIAGPIIGLDPSAMHSTVVINNPDLIGYERTPKGGLHASISPVASSLFTRYRIPIKTELIQYMMNNIAHGFYVSVWAKFTRYGSVERPFFGVSSSSYTANRIFTLRTVGLPAPSPNYSALPALNPGENVPYFCSLYTANQVGVGTATDLNLISFLIGSWGGATPAGCPSIILYKATIEDLALSGRTYAQAQAADQALFNEAFAVGGRFYGDTYSAPKA